MPGLKSFDVAGFKSVRNPQQIDLPGLTIVAGANSTGKSSVIQPLLLFKQTLQSAYEPDELRLSGPNLEFSDTSQLFWHAPGVASTKGRFTLLLSGEDEKLRLSYRPTSAQSVQLVSTEYEHFGAAVAVKLTGELSGSEIAELAQSFFPHDESMRQYLERNRDALLIAPGRLGHALYLKGGQGRQIVYDIGFNLKNSAATMIHLPGLRGNPERTYPRTGIGPGFPGQFQDYFASILHSWKSGDNRRKAVARDLSALGLGWKVETKSREAGNIEVKVTRLPRARQGGARDLVSLADTGIGVSQVLPVITSLHVARKGQIVFVEQPEIHLHPRAQQALAGVFAEAVKRGVILIVETHSEVLLESLLTLVATDQLNPQRVLLYWASRDEEGVTAFRRCEISPGGRMDSDVPMDFAAVRLEVLQRRLLSNYPED